MTEADQTLDRIYQSENGQPAPSDDQMSVSVQNLDDRSAPAAKKTQTGGNWFLTFLTFAIIIVPTVAVLVMVWLKK